MKKKWIFFIATFIGILITLLLYNFINHGKKDLISENAELVIFANNLFEEFEKDEIAATKMYNGKIIDVKGKIGEITKVNEKDLIFVLKEKDDIYGINCMILVKGVKLNHYLVGDSIIIRGILQGYLSDVILNNCAIIK